MAEFLREILKSNQKIIVPFKDERFVLVYAWDCEERNRNSKFNVFLLETVKDKERYSDRIYVIGNETFEAIKVSLIMKGFRNVKVKGASELREIISMSGEGFDGNSLEIFKISKSYGKNIYLSYVAEVDALIVACKNKCFVFKDATINELKGEIKPFELKLRSECKKLLHNEVLLSAMQGLILVGYISYSLEEPLQISAILQTSLDQKYLELEYTRTFIEAHNLCSIPVDFHKKLLNLQEIEEDISSPLEFSVSDLYIISQRSVPHSSKSISFKVHRKLSLVKQLLIPKLKYLKSQNKAFNLSFLSQIQNKTSLDLASITQILNSYKTNHPALQISIDLILEPLTSSIPILLIASPSFKGKQELADYLGYSLSQYKRDCKLKANTIYETDLIQESIIKSTKIITLFIQWDDESKHLFLKELKTMQKSELPPGLMKYSKKTGEDAIPGIENFYNNMQQRIRNLKGENSEFVMVLDGLYPSHEFPKVYAKIQNFPRFEEEKEEVNESASVSQEIKHPVCLIMVILGIPGMGKTFLKPVIQKVAVDSGFEFYYLSSDEIRNRCIIEYQRKNPTADREKAFSNTFKQANITFLKELTTKIKSSASSLFIYLDKNQTPTGFQNFQQQLENSEIKNTSIQMISLWHKTNLPITLPGRFYEFSVELLVVCIKRSLTREHLTLFGDKAKITSIVFGIFSCFNNHCYDSYFQSRKVKHLIQVPFIDESKIIIPQVIREKIMMKIENLRDGFEIDPELEELAIMILDLELGEYDATSAIRAELEKVMQPYIKSLKRIEDKKLEEAEKLHQDAKERKRKNKQEKKVDKRGFHKPPTYIGIKAEKPIRPIVLDFVLEKMARVLEYFEDGAVRRDIEQIQFLKQDRNSAWKHPISYHVTSMFIGRAAEKLKSQQFCNFKCGLEIQLHITHFVYSPSLIACAKAQVISPLVEIENKIPHITLLLGKKPAVFSNTILQHVNFDQDFFSGHFEDQGCRNIIYSYKLPEPLFIVGKTKYFY